ncbi:MAG: SUMF1/EgtB/PvdO family nonheme iron enzyme [bacterium]
MLPRVIHTSKDKGEMVLVPGGAFRFGIRQDDVRQALAELNEPADPIFGTELSPRNAIIRDCYIDRRPVTNAQYALFIEETGHAPPLYWNERPWNAPDRPVVGLCFREAEAYGRWAQKRLPSEEEWERAARGTDHRRWPWGDDFGLKNCNSREWNAGMTTEVGKFPSGRSPAGCDDMAGNVWEFTTGNWENFGKAIRGGSWKNSAAFCRTTCRWGIDPEIKGSTWLGFRCVMDLAKARIYGQVKP